MLAHSSGRMALPLLRLADLLLTQCGAADLWPRDSPANGSSPEPADRARLEVSTRSLCFQQLEDNHTSDLI